jgi:hypothetical protein
VPAPGNVPGPVEVHQFHVNETARRKTIPRWRAAHMWRPPIPLSRPGGRAAKRAPPGRA